MLKKISIKQFFLLLGALCATLSSSAAVVAVAKEAPRIGASENPAFRATKYPLPRFVSLASGKAFVRSGPGRQYPVLWVFKKKAVPVEVVLEYDTWRKIRDHEGEEGWVHQSLLSGKRAGITQTGERLPLHKKPKKESRVLAYLDPGVVLAVESCNGTWCRISASGYKGWVLQKAVWGVYEGEIFD